MTTTSSVSSTRITSPKEVVRIAERRSVSIAKAAKAYGVIYPKFLEADAAYKAANAEYDYYDGIGWKLDGARAEAVRRHDWLAVAWFDTLTEWNTSELDRCLKVCDKLGRKAEKLEDELFDLDDIVTGAY